MSGGYFCANLRAAHLLAESGVGSALTAHFRNARVPPIGSQPKPLAAAPRALYHMPTVSHKWELR